MMRPPIHPRFKRGAKPTSRHKLAAARPHRPSTIAPSMFAIVPKQLDVWGNDTYGDCVTAEEAFAKACAQPEIFIMYSEVIAWANAHGFLDGAMLPDVMDAMAKSGFVQGDTYGDGPYTAVDFSNEPILQNAIATGPVKIGIDANALPSGAGNQQGWFATGGTPGQFNNEDHCVGLCGYGTSSYLFAQLGVPLPSTFTGQETGYLLFTWATIGFVDHAWLMSTCGEAWLRNPTTTDNGIPVPQPGPAPTPTPTPTPTPVPPNPTPPTPTPPASFTVAFPQGLMQAKDLRDWIAKGVTGSGTTPDGKTATIAIPDTTAHVHPAAGNGTVDPFSVQVTIQ